MTDDDEHFLFLLQTEKIDPSNEENMRSSARPSTEEETEEASADSFFSLRGPYLIFIVFTDEKIFRLLRHHLTHSEGK